MTTADRSASPARPAVDIRRLLLRAVLLPLLLMGVVAGCLFWQVQRLSQANARVDQSDRLIAQANQAQKAILDRETGLRGFLVTEERVFLQPYEEARPERALDELAVLCAGDPAQATRIDELRASYADWRDKAEEAIEHPEMARAPTVLRKRKTEMDAIRASVARIIQAEDGVRAGLVRRVRAERQVMELGAVPLLLAVAGVLAISTRGALRQAVVAYDDALARREAGEAALADMLERERDARREAQEALRAKDEFLSMLSHELRTPLTAILGWAGVLRGKGANVTAELAARAIAVVERNAKSQAQIVDDLLDVSRIVSGKLKLRVVRTDVTAVVRAAFDVVRFSAESKGVALELQVADASIWTRGDPDRLQQVVWNLLTNAVKFTQGGGRVTVAVAREGARVRVRVSDTGEGIAPEFLPHVFERFRQADSSLKRAHGGLGLGLAIVKHLVDLHGGEVAAESAGKGRGAVLTVTLPIALDTSLRPSAPSDAPEPRAGMSLAGIRALVVDDEPDTLALVATVLSEQGAVVECAPSGAAALTLLDQRQVDVIVSDIGMPELDGYELLEKIRERPMPAPALALTAHAATEDVERARRAGFERHMAKPITPEHLVQAVAELAGRV